MNTSQTLSALGFLLLATTLEVSGHAFTGGDLPLQPAVLMPADTGQAFSELARAGFFRGGYFSCCRGVFSVPMIWTPVTRSKPATVASISLRAEMTPAYF